MEWSLHAVIAKQATPSCNYHVRCLRIMGVRGSLWSRVVSVELGWQTGTFAYQCQGTDANSVALWGKKWQGKSLLVQSDNTAAVAMVNSQTSHDTEAMHLIRCLTFILARFQLTLSAVHIPGKENNLADALSRNNLAFFHSVFPQAERHQTEIPTALVELLLGARPDWISTQWTEMWNIIFPGD